MKKEKLVALDGMFGSGANEIRKEKLVVLNGMFGRGINGMAEIRITTTDNIDMEKDVVTFNGSMEKYDEYFKKHPLYGKHTFTVKTSNILAIVE